MKKRLQGVLGLAVLIMVLLALSGCSTADVNAAFQALNDAGPSVSTPGATPTALPTLGLFTFKGTVEGVSSDSLIVNSITFRVDAQTGIPEGLQPGDYVAVQAVLLPDGTYYALEVKRLERSGEQEFKFYGLVESIGASEWQISGQSVQITAQTNITPGIQVGDLVEVEGQVVEGVLVAAKISLEDKPHPKSTPEAGDVEEVEWFGAVMNINGDVWTVGDQTVQVTSQTELKGNPNVGDLVKVHAFQRADGSFVAKEIEKIRTLPADSASPNATSFKFYGTVESINGQTWVISGTSVQVDGSTQLKGNPVVGSNVEVKALVQSDGTYLAREIKVKDSGNGRLDFRATPKPEDDHEDQISTPKADDSHQGEGISNPGNSKGSDDGEKQRSTGESSKENEHSSDKDHPSDKEHKK